MEREFTPQEKPEAAGGAPQGTGTLALAPWEGPAILLVDLDAFFASVEQLDHPGWRGKPVIVGGDADRHGVVSTASYEARVFGVHSAMPSSTARRLCPQAIWTRGHFDRYREVSNAIMGILRDETPHVQQVSIDEAFLDVSPTAVNREHPVDIARRIQRRVEELGVTCSVGVGTSKTVAKIASDMDKPRGLTVVYPGSERGLPGAFAGARHERHRRGGRGEAACAGHPHARPAGRCRRGGAVRLFRQERARSCTCARSAATIAPVEADDEVKSVSNEMTFARDLTTREDVEAALATIAAKVGRRLRRKGLAGRTPVRAGAVSRPQRAVRATSAAASHRRRAGLHALLYRMVRGSVASGHAGAASGGGHEWLRGRAHGAGEPASRGGGGRRAEADVEPVVADAGKRRGLIAATDAVKDRFGETAVRFGRELRGEGNTTGSAPRTPPTTNKRHRLAQSVSEKDGEALNCREGFPKRTGRT